MAVLADEMYTRRCHHEATGYDIWLTEEQYKYQEGIIATKKNLIEAIREDYSWMPENPSPFDISAAMLLMEGAPTNQVHKAENYEPPQA